MESPTERPKSNETDTEESGYNDLELSFVRFFDRVAEDTIRRIFKKPKVSSAMPGPGSKEAPNAGVQMLPNESVEEVDSSQSQPAQIVTSPMEADANESVEDVESSQASLLTTSPTEADADVSNINPETGTKPKNQCQVCRKVLSSPANLRAHLLTHEGNKAKPYHCSTCKKTYCTRFSLQRHELNHQEKKEKCTQCDRRFTTNDNLQRHYRVVHEKKYSFQCSQCSKQFGNSSGLRRHERRHVGEKPHLCLRCGARFPELRNLRRHVETKHTENPTEYPSNPTNSE